VLGANDHRCIAGVLQSSPSVSYLDVSNMFVDHDKNMWSQMQQMIEESLTKSF
jgi:hypothetical protein